MPEDMSDRMPEDMPDRMPEDLPDRMPEDMPEDMPDHMPEDMPDRMPNRMSEDMSDRMPEDLPVRKCINVMVGITRSKVRNDRNVCNNGPAVKRKARHQRWPWHAVTVLAHQVAVPEYQLDSIANPYDQYLLGDNKCPSKSFSSRVKSLMCEPPTPDYVPKLLFTA